MPSQEKPQIVLGRVIRKLRRQRELTQEALAHRAGITVGHLSKIERGQSNPSWSTVCSIAAALETSMGPLGKLVDRHDS